MNAPHQKLTDHTGDRPRFALVYQAGIASLFRVWCFNTARNSDRNAARVYQGDFRSAENLATGAGLAGAVVMSFACNEAGDITASQWATDLEAAPFSESFRPVFYTVGL